MRFVSRGIGMFRVSRGDSYELPPGHLESFSDDVTAERVEGWIGDHPDDPSLGFALPPDQRGSADAAADTQMDTAQFACLIDNTTIAVAHVDRDTAGRSAWECRLGVLRRRKC